MMAELRVKFKINPVAEYVNIWVQCKATKKELRTSLSAEEWLDLTGEDITK